MVDRRLLERALVLLVFARVQLGDRDHVLELPVRSSDRRHLHGLRGGHRRTRKLDAGPGLIESIFLVNSGKAAAIAVSSGSPQSASVHSAFRRPLVAKVTDSERQSGLRACMSPSPPRARALREPSPPAPAATPPPTSASSRPTRAASPPLRPSRPTRSPAVPYTVTATTSGVSGPAELQPDQQPRACEPAGLHDRRRSPVRPRRAPPSDRSPSRSRTPTATPSMSSANTTVNLSSNSTGGIFATDSGGIGDHLGDDLVGVEFRELLLRRLPRRQPEDHRRLGIAHLGHPDRDDLQGEPDPDRHRAGEWHMRARPSRPARSARRSRLLGSERHGHDHLQRSSARSPRPRRAAQVGMDLGRHGDGLGQRHLPPLGRLHPDGRGQLLAGTPVYGGDSNNNSAASNCPSACPRPSSPRPPRHSPRPDLRPARSAPPSRQLDQLAFWPVARTRPARSPSRSSDRSPLPRRAARPAAPRSGRQRSRATAPTTRRQVHPDRGRQLLLVRLLRRRLEQQHRPRAAAARGCRRPWSARPARR